MKQTIITCDCCKKTIPSNERVYLLILPVIKYAGKEDVKHDANLMIGMKMNIDNQPMDICCRCYRKLADSFKIKLMGNDIKFPKNITI